ncbi:MAG TPA: hypothetical protein ENK57_26680, partial [Polyangiaceae bacterium]|nr:hypothetical protein [Polyangiaceae bacterium]
MSRTQVTALALMFAALTVNGAQAQDASPPADEEPAGEAATPPTVAPAPTPRAMPRDPHYARPRPPPPIMVVVLPGARVSEELTAAARSALV